MGAESSGWDGWMKGKTKGDAVAWLKDQRLRYTMMRKNCLRADPFQVPLWPIVNHHNINLF